ncbi:uncharacterized protein LOC119771266 [Culex quinquefasciatus]|uniref:uncharacterized protein LOC119771266 n=1 Tax=Culex quinquefasciatus TaxID=7176 RepID=UPI0018E38035|nr:uncharacterized protein LOC119771266 [Culex quinquefasciatus]
MCCSGALRLSRERTESASWIVFFSGACVAPNAYFVPLLPKGGAFSGSISSKLGSGSSSYNNSWILLVDAESAATAVADVISRARRVPVGSPEEGALNSKNWYRPRASRRLSAGPSGRCV